jgi:phospholipid-binding lipoprotein MlaA
MLLPLKQIITRLVLSMMLIGFLSVSHARTVEDPFVGYNRDVESFNAGVDSAILKPVTQSYVDVIPDPIRIAGKNFVNNLQEPVTILNALLQGKLEQSIQDTARFIFNSTLGLFGLIDIATPMGLVRHDEDFGQTFAVWGWQESAYLNLPLLGPSTVRDAIAKPFSLMMTTYGTAFTSVRILSLRESLMPLDPLIDAAPDRYTFVRDGFMQQRGYLIHDGQKTVTPSPLKDFDFSE